MAGLHDGQSRTTQFFSVREFRWKGLSVSLVSTLAVPTGVERMGLLSTSSQMWSANTSLALLETTFPVLMGLCEQTHGCVLAAEPSWLSLFEVIKVMSASGFSSSSRRMPRIVATKCPTNHRYWSLHVPRFYIQCVVRCTFIVHESSHANLEGMVWNISCFK